MSLGGLGLACDQRLGLLEVLVVEPDLAGGVVGDALTHGLALVDEVEDLSRVDAVVERLLRVDRHELRTLLLGVRPGRLELTDHGVPLGQERVLEHGFDRLLIEVKRQIERRRVGLVDQEGPLVARSVQARQGDLFPVQFHGAEGVHPANETAPIVAGLVVEDVVEQPSEQGRVPVLFGVQQALDRIRVNGHVQGHDVLANGVLARLNGVLGHEHQLDHLGGLVGRSIGHLTFNFGFHFGSLSRFHSFATLVLRRTGAVKG